MKIETKRLIITEFTMDMAEAVHISKRYCGEVL